MKARGVLLIVLGWLLLKYLLLGNVSFEDSFKYGMMYHGGALLFVSFGSAWLGVKSGNPTPSFLDGFKSIAKATVGYAVGAAAVIGIWHHVYMGNATNTRLQEQVSGIQNQFSTEEAFRSFAAENDIPATVSLEDWMARSIEQIETLYAPGVQITLSLMLYVVLGLFISLIASFLWTKVWFVQHPAKKNV